MVREDTNQGGGIKSHRVAVGHSQTAPTKLFRQYDWDVNDRLTQIIHNGKTATTFEHDQWGNLSKTTFGDGEIQLRNPDKVGNLFETKDRKDKKYDKAGRLIESKTASYKYNLDGFLIEKKLKNGDIWKYFWSAAGTLEKVIRPDKQEVVYKYDALGRRIWKKISKTTTKWLWDGNKVLHEYKEFAFRESTADDLITWIFEEDSFTPCAKLKGNKKYSLICDHIGVPIQGYNEEGSLIWERELDSYGKKRQEVGDEGFCSITYQGQVYDKDIELTYNRMRWYNQDEGVYVSSDPIGLNGGTVLYGYVEDPNIWVDVLGLSPSCKKVQQLQNGPNKTVVTVGSKKEADALLKAAFPNAQKVRGIGSQDATGIRKKRKMDEFKKKDGIVRYRKDYPIDSKTGRVYGHDDPKGTGHGEKPHINIKREDGTMVRIDIDKK